jgi:alkanesulfonate monooxygenase SsuD/methylene tetrahydromethanopterin reductase-like flavin-dependent oxidoreductase (luciferase family)
VTNFELRFDLRNPAFAGVDGADRAEAALAMIEWGERLGFSTVTLSEHHGSPDGYLPSPLVFAAAVAARTERIRIRIGALIAALHDPLRVAEDLAVLDQLSRGRVDVVIANGYVASELAMFGRTTRDRVPAVVELVETLQLAWTGEPFEFRGRTVRVTPRPVTRPRPSIMLGGSSRPAARRAAEIADLFIPSDAGAWEHYREAVVERGGPDFGPFPRLGPRFVHVVADVEAGWEAVGPFVAHDREAYGAWAEGAGLDTGQRRISERWGLRDDPDYVVVTPGGCADLIRALGPTGTFLLAPMAGGVPPDVAWSSLRLVEELVLPQV